MKHVNRCSLAKPLPAKAQTQEEICDGLRDEGLNDLADLLGCPRRKKK